MQLIETIIINKNHKYYNELDNLCFLSKNLYNSALYYIRQEYILNKKYKNYYDVNNYFMNTKQKDYYALPCKVSQQILKLVDKNFKSFFQLLKQKDKKVKLPKYLNKTNGRQVVIYTIQAISQKELKNNIIKLSGTEISLKIRDNIKNINQVRIVKHYTTNTFNIEVVYTIKEKELLENNGRYASIDLGVNNLGVNNLVTLSSNVIKPIIINGKPLKSINQYFNKKIGEFKSKGLEKTNKFKLLSKKHKNKTNDYLHKTSRYIINHLVSNEINTLVIGKNKEWKQEINIGKVNNQNFVNIPHSRLIDMLIYKCKMIGINTILEEESYTSKCSFLDKEAICKHEVYKGKRIKRGLFKSSLGKLINADLNGSLNILRKAIGEFEYPIEACSTPVTINLL